MDSKEANRHSGFPQVAHYYDQHIWKPGETYRIRVSNIYDISKFWIVLLEQELTLFQKFIHKFYTDKGEKYKIPTEQLHNKMYCVAFVEGSFYRGMIVDIPLFADSIQRAIVLLIDYGQVLAVKFEELYYFYDKFYQVPRFAVRACLSQIQPSNKDTWTSNVIHRFNELVSEKVLLCILESTDPVNKIVYITIGDVDQQSEVHDIGDILLKENMAIPITAKKGSKRKKRLVPVTKYPFLFPTFEAIEQGEMPSSAKIFDLLKHSRVSNDLLNSYYNFNEILY